MDKKTNMFLCNNSFNSLTITLKGDLYRGAYKSVAEIATALLPTLMLLVNENSKCNHNKSPKVCVLSKRLY